METLRVHRPRVVLHGPIGMGQSYVAAAILHHLEGYHVQSLDLGNLLSDSTRVCNFPFTLDLNLVSFRRQKQPLCNCSLKPSVTSHLSYTYRL